MPFGQPGSERLTEARFEITRFTAGGASFFRMHNREVSLIPLGGVGEIGKNMWAVEYEGEILVLDAGVMFPDDEMLGVDLVIPDISYLLDNASRVQAIVLSHGHEDHIGALPYVLKQLAVPVYGTRLTLGLVQAKLEEHDLLRGTELIEVMAGDRIRIGAFDVEFIHVNHSVADVVNIAIHTPLGAVIYATDFKIDHTPIDGRVIDIGRFAALGSEGVLCLLSDSTNAERPGYTLSERTVGDSLMQAFAESTGRIVVATFASNIHRIQQVFDAAFHHNRKVCVVGRSMVNNVTIASELGYLTIPEGLLIPIDQLESHRPEEVVVLSTGSQGEPMAALTRMATGEHRSIDIRPGDTVIISAHPIPGNERYIGRTIDMLFRKGAEVIYQQISGMHVSGHASQEELKMMLNLTRPKYFIPIHGEYRMLYTHSKIAQRVGVPANNIVIPDIGDRIVLTADSIRKTGRVESGVVLVDGLGVGDVGNVVLRDRQQLAKDGIFVAVLALDPRTGEVVAGPEIISRGFVYMKESESLIEEARDKIRQLVAARSNGSPPDWSAIRNQTRDVLSRFLYERTKRRPIVLPVLMEAED